MWGSTGLLRDLELRLALSGAISPRSVRVPRYAAQIAALGDAGAFYAASFATDALGTADTLLAWRDALVEAGWLEDSGVRRETNKRPATVWQLTVAGRRHLTERKP